MARKIIKDIWLADVIEVYKAKELNPTITNKECGDMLNEKFNQNFGESAWRKTYWTAIKGFELMKTELDQGTITQEEADRIIAAVATSRNKLMLQQKITTEMRKQLHTDMRIAAKYKIIDEAFLSLRDYKFKEIKFHTVTSKNGIDIPVYTFSDLHYGLLVDITTNKYSPEIAKERMSKFIDFIVSDMKIHDYKEFILLDGGDIIEGSGNLRASQWLSTTMSMMQQVVNVADFMTSFYLELNNALNNNIKKPVYGSIYMVTASNHTQLRIGNTKRDEVENDDVSLVIGNIIRNNIQYIGESIYTSRNEGSVDKFDDEITEDDYSLNVFMADEHLIDINGITLFLTHGHKFKYATSIHNVLSNRDNILVDIVMSGHWHSFKEETVGARDRIINKKKIFLPCVCGDTGYTNNLGYSSAPAALKSIFSSKYGNIGNILIPFD